MISEEEIIKYHSFIKTQYNMLKQVDVDPHREEDAHEYLNMINEKRGQLNALDYVIGLQKVKCIPVITFTIYGASDDLVEIEGDLREEVGAYDTDLKFYMSDGTFGSINYTDEGVWRIKILTYGIADIKITNPTEEEIEEDTNYTDKAVFSGPIEWIVFGDGTLLKV